jgi:hypothetical protein
VEDDEDDERRRREAHCAPRERREWTADANERDARRDQERDAAQGGDVRRATLEVVELRPERGEALGVVSSGGFVGVKDAGS